MKKQTRKTASKANFALHLFLLPPEPVPGTCCPEHPQHRPFCPSPWAPPGPFPSHPSAPAGKAPTGAGGVFGEAPLSCDFHGKRAVTPRRQQPAPKPTQIVVCPKRFSCPACRTHLQGQGRWGWRRVDFIPILFLALFPHGLPSAPGGAPGPLASLRCAWASSGKGSFRSSDGGQWIDTWQVLLLLFIAPSLCSD